VKLIIEPGRSASEYWRELWHYRELLYFLAWRDLAVRYKQTVIGVAWALIRPALTMVVFVLFRRLMGAERSHVSDVLLVLSAVLPWQLFANALSESSTSLINNTNLLSKVYFPRLIIPGASVAAALVDFLITLGLLAVVMIWQGFAPGWTLAALPFFVIATIALSTGIGLFLAALNVQYRDFRYVVPFIIQIGLFVSPIAFASANVPERWKLLYSFNPLVGIIDGFRWSILGSQTPLDTRAVAMSLVITVLSVGYGVWYFRRMERRFADVI
jgi:lipopolysaccharide transport system permease protein